MSEACVTQNDSREKVQPFNLPPVLVGLFDFSYTEHKLGGATLVFDFSYTERKLGGATLVQGDQPPLPTHTNTQKPMKKNLGFALHIPQQ